MKLTNRQLQTIVKEELESLFTDPATLGTGARLARPTRDPGDIDPTEAYPPNISLRSMKRPHTKHRISSPERKGLEKTYKETFYTGDEFRDSPDYEHPTTEAGQEFLRWGVPYADVMRLDYEMNPMHYWAKEKESDQYNRYPETREGMRATGGYPEAARNVKESYKKRIGANTMKLTKSKLKRFLKEELQNVLLEEQLQYIYVLNEQRRAPEAAARRSARAPEKTQKAWKIKGGAQGKGKDPAKKKFYKIPKSGFERIHKRHDEEYFKRQGTGADWDKLTPKEQADWRKKRKASENPPVKAKPKPIKFFQEEFKKVLTVRDPNLEARVEDIRNQIGDEMFIKELVNAVPDEILKRFAQNVAKENQLTVRGVPYAESIK